MRKLFLVLLTLMAVVSITGCERSEADKQRAHEIKMAKIESGQDLAENEMRHQRQMAYYGYNVPRPVGPVAPGAYIDYRGNPAYGYWGVNGYWHWNDPNSIYAIQTRNYLNYQIATGVVSAAILTAALSRDDWDRDHRSGWSEKKVTVNKYYSSDGKEISKSEYTTRNKSYESKRDKWKSDRKAFRSSYEKKNPDKVAEYKRKSESAAVSKSGARTTSKTPTTKVVDKKAAPAPSASGARVTPPTAKPSVQAKTSAQLTAERKAREEAARKKYEADRKKREAEAQKRQEKRSTMYGASSGNRFSSSGSSTKKTENRFRKSTTKKCTYKNGKKVCS